MKIKGRAMSDNFVDLRSSKSSPQNHRLVKQADKASSSQQLTDTHSAYEAEYRKRGSAGTKVASQKLKNLQDSHKPKSIDRSLKAPSYTKGFMTNDGIK